MVTASRGEGPWAERYLADAGFVACGDGSQPYEATREGYEEAVAFLAVAERIAMLDHTRDQMWLHVDSERIRSRTPFGYCLDGGVLVVDALEDEIVDHILELRAAGDSDEDIINETGVAADWLAVV